jgi:hypothetical protein
MMHRKAAKTMGMLAAAIMLLGSVSLAHAQSTESLSGPGSDLIYLVPNTGIVKNYTLNDVIDFRNLDSRDYHTSYILALPSDFTSPAPLDLTITTTPTVKPGDAQFAVMGIVDITPTYSWNYASGGKITTKFSGLPYGVGVLFTFVTKAINDPEAGEPEFPVSIKQEFSLVPTPKK